MKIAIVFFMMMSVLCIDAMDKELKTVKLKPMAMQRYESCVTLSFLFDKELMPLLEGQSLHLVMNNASTAQESSLSMQLESLDIQVDFNNNEKLNLSNATIDHKVGSVIATIIIPKKA